MAVPTVLLVDDEPEVLNGLSLVLAKQPYRVAVAQSAADALAVLAEQPIDVIVSDEQMPGMVGSELLSEVAASYPNVMRIILTGHASLDAAVRAINGGRVFRYLKKPCLPDDLRAAIGEAIRERVLWLATAHLVEAATAVTEGGASRRSAERGISPRFHVFGGLSQSETEALSCREREVLYHLAIEGRRVADIGKTLFISLHTVRNHLKAIFRKLDVHSQSELVRKARG